MVEHFRGRFVGMASIDSANSIRENLDIIRTYAVDGPLKGIHFEPGHSSLPLYADDPKFYPIYEYCQEQGLVVGIMLGGNNGPNLINHTNRPLSRSWRRTFRASTGSYAMAAGRG